jgi:hypothetical protein
MVERIRTERILEVSCLERGNRCKLNHFLRDYAMEMQCCVQADVGWAVDLVGKIQSTVRNLQILGERI